MYIGRPPVQVASPAVPLTGLETKTRLLAMLRSSGRIKEESGENLDVLLVWMTVWFGMYRCLKARGFDGGTHWGAGW